MILIYPTSSIASLCKRVLLFFTLFFSIQELAAQNLISYSIGEILAAGSGGLVLADGTLAHAEIVTLNSSNVALVDHGTYNTQQMGGILNGINNPLDASGTIDSSALTIAQYTGSRRVGDFTRISALPSSIDNGKGSQFGNAIGFRIWFSKPINVKQFLMLDCDGNGDNTDPQNPATNGEWFSCFAYNGTAKVFPSAITLAPGTDLTNNIHSINSNWDTLVLHKIPGADTFSSMIFPRITANHNNVDPDDIKNQGLFDFSAPVDNVFFLWGIYGVVGTGSSAMQNSGVSPLVFSLYTDFGDAPDTYHTSKVNDGASHSIYNYVAGAQNSTLTLGTGVNFESTGIPGPLANSDADDAITSVPGFDCGSSTYWVNTSVLNNTGSPANLYAWVDFNQNGQFDPAEIITQVINSDPSPQAITLTWNGIVPGPTCGTPSATYMRLRLTFDNLVDNIATSIDERSFGGANGGEVEDYRLTALPQGGSLPVVLSSFSSSAANDKVLLSWIVNNDISNNYFEIERSSDGIHFTAIDKISSKGNSLTANSYVAADIVPLSGLNYYRLKIIDKGGTVTFSKIISERITGDHIAVIAVKPNPFVNNIDVNINLPKAGTFAVSMTDAIGKTIYKNTINGNAGINWLQLDKLNNLPQGVYIISIKTSATTNQYRVVKAN